MSQMTDFLILNTWPHSRPILARADQIDLIVEEKTPNGVFPAGKRTKVVLRNGESGYCKETVAAIMMVMRDIHPGGIHGTTEP